MTQLERESLVGIDNIRMELPVAGVGSRALAVIVDTTLEVLLVGLLALVLWALPLPSAAWSWSLFAVGYFLLHWGYYAGSEAATRGRTPGKAAVGLRVVAREGGTPEASAFLIRALVRPVDLLVGVFLVAFDPLGRRLGDRLAGTLVIHDRRAEEHARLERAPAAWQPREVALVESFLARRHELEPDQARYLARRLLAWVQRDEPALLAGVDTESDPAAALAGVLLQPAAEGGEG